MTPSNSASQVHVISNVGAFVDEWTYVLDLQDLPAERADVMIDGVRFFVDRSPFAFRVISPSDDARDFRINFDDTRAGYGRGTQRRAQRRRAHASVGAPHLDRHRNAAHHRTGEADISIPQRMCRS